MFPRFNLAPVFAYRLCYNRLFKMFAEKACKLVKELSRNEDVLPPYNSELVTDVRKEINQLVTENYADLNQTNSDQNLQPTSKIRHAAIKRNVRCLLAYHYNRLRSVRTMRWEFGSVLPADIKQNLSTAEVEWFSKYSQMLAKYMRTIGEDGVNLVVDLKPPKALYIEVRCLTDYGKYELNDGTVLLLKKDTRHYLPRSECEELIRQGVFEHIE